MQHRGSGSSATRRRHELQPGGLQAVIGDMTEALREHGIGTLEVGEIVNLLYAAPEAAPPR